MVYTFLVIGGESSTMKQLHKIFKQFPNYKCIGIFEDHKGGLNSILKDAPDIVFIDIDVKNKIGDPFKFVNEINQYLNILPCFMALSSSKVQAYDVIKNNFIDYLLKPISELELRKCLYRFQKGDIPKNLNKICLRSYSDYRFLDLEEILYLKADNNTTDFHLIDTQKISAFKTLKYFGDILPNTFLRVHHSYIINVEQVTRINFAKSRIILGRKHTSIPFSKSYKPQVDLLKEDLFKSLSVIY